MDTKRFMLLMSLILTIFMALLGRVFYYQIIRGPEISRQAVAMRSQTLELREYRRGDIVDRNLIPLTSTRISIAVYIAPGSIGSDPDSMTGQGQTNPDESISNLISFLTANLENIDTQAIHAAIKSALPSSSPILINSNLSSSEIERINNAQPAGLVMAPFINRYREDGFCAHLLGYVNQSPDGQGWAGLEKAYNQVLQSTSSSPAMVSVVDARGQAIPGLTGKIQSQTDKEGQVVLTIDRRIQEVVEQSMDERVEKGAAVVMDIQSKEILAMVSRPTFNPYAVNEVIAYDNRSTLTNRALSKYHPGSIFKILLSVAVLEEGLAGPDDQFNCSGKYVFNDQVSINCWQEEGHGSLTLAQAFANSCNPSFIEVGLRLGAKRVLEYVDKMHLTDETIIGYYPGNIGTYVKIDGGEPALGNASLGQEGVMLSPLQIASLLSTVADNGSWGPPSLVKSIVSGDSQESIYSNDYREQVISPATASQVCQWMEMVVEEGTGSTAAIDEVKVAGKTATSQTGRMRSDDEEVLNTWFAGYLPADQPRWAIVVMAEEGTSGSQDCAPIFREISRGILNYF